MVGLLPRKVISPATRLRNEAQGPALGFVTQPLCGRETRTKGIDCPFRLTPDLLAEE
jgi:hypothetical protein